MCQADVTILSQRTSHLVVQDMKLLNKSLEHLKQYVVPVRVVGVDPAKGGWAVFTDASLNNLDDSKTQLAFVLGMTDKFQLSSSGTSNFSMVAWSSHRMKRVASSTLLTEIAALGEGLSQAELADEWFKYAMDGEYVRKGFSGREIKLIPWRRERWRRSTMLLLSWIPRVCST